MGKPASLIKGRTYTVNHCDNLKFVMRMSNMDKHKVHGYVVSGESLVVGDHISVRRSLATFTPFLGVSDESKRVD